MSEVASGDAQLVIAAPPFTFANQGELDKLSYLETLGTVFAECVRILRPSGVLVVINTDLRDHARLNRGDGSFDGCIWQKHTDLRTVAESVGLRCIDLKIWAKSLRQNKYRYTYSFIQFFQASGLKAHNVTRGATSAEFAADVWLLPGGGYRRDSEGYVFRDAIHPEVARYCIEQLTNPGDLVVAPFAGSGTVLAVARLVGRRSIGFEVDTRLHRMLRESINRPERFGAYAATIKNLKGASRK